MNALYIFSGHMTSQIVHFQKGMRHPNLSDNSLKNQL